MPWYVVSESPERGDDKLCWTVSQHPEKCGWESDGGYPGYGLLRAEAQFLVDAANEKEAREGRAFPLRVEEEEWEF